MRPFFATRRPTIAPCAGPGGVPTLLCALGLAALGAGCAAGRVRVPIVRPAEVNLAAYKTVALAEMEGGPPAAALCALLEEDLLQGARFELVDRQHMGSVMNELQLSASDLADTHNAAKLGKLVTASLLLSGNVQESYSETPVDNTFKDKSGVEHFHRSYRVDAKVSASFRLTEVSTGKLLLARTVESKRDNISKLKEAAGALLGGLLQAALDVQTDQFDPTPDRESILRDARQEVVKKFSGAIAPRKEWREVRFELDDDLPQLQATVGWAGRGEWDKAQAAASEAIRDSEKNPRITSKTLAKAWYDLGLSYAYGGEYDKAMTALQRAYDLSANKAMLDALDEVRALQSDARRVAEQQEAPPAH